MITGADGGPNPSLDIRSSYLQSSKSERPKRKLFAKGSLPTKVQRSASRDRLNACTLTDCVADFKMKIGHPRHFFNAGLASRMRELPERKFAENIGHGFSRKKHGLDFLLSVFIRVSSVALFWIKYWLGAMRELPEFRTRNSRRISRLFLSHGQPCCVSSQNSWNSCENFLNRRNVRLRNSIFATEGTQGTKKGIVAQADRDNHDPRRMRRSKPHNMYVCGDKGAGWKIL